MKKTDRVKKVAEGLVVLGWLTFSLIIFVITLLARIIWRTKIATFLLGIGILLLVVTVILFLLWKRSLKN